MTVDLTLTKARTLVNAAIIHAEVRTKLSDFKTDEIGVVAKPPKKVELSQSDARRLLALLTSLDVMKEGRADG